jgi:hypothetical protein
MDLAPNFVVPIRFQKNLLSFNLKFISNVKIFFFKLIILPSNNPKIIQKINKIYKLKKVKENFSYNSGANKKFLKISEIRKLIKENIDSKFKPC